MLVRADSVGDVLNSKYSRSVKKGQLPMRSNADLCLKGSIAQQSRKRRHQTRDQQQSMLDLDASAEVGKNYVSFIIARGNR